MRKYKEPILLLFFVLPASFVNAQVFPVFQPGMLSVAMVPLPKGYQRLSLPEGSFAAFLRNLPLRKDRTVYLYNGNAKGNQLLHYAVIDYATGKKDLQQCADVVMRLRAEFFLAGKQLDSIVFYDGDHRSYRFADKVRNCKTDMRTCFMQYMETVFANCGTYSLEKQLRPASLPLMQPGDVLIKGGSPGHAQIVVDMAIDKITGRKIYLLAEGYMPAQDMHVVLNTAEPLLGPWFVLEPGKNIVTPTWEFTPGQLRKW